MPTLLCELDTVGYWGGEGEEGDWNPSPFIINDLDLEIDEVVTNPPNSLLSPSLELNTSIPSVMGATSEVSISSTNDCWCKIEIMDEESYLSMSPPDPFSYPDNLQWRKFGAVEYNSCADEMIVPDLLMDSSDYGVVDDVLNYDCMWGGGCPEENESRTLPRQSSSCSASSNAKCYNGSSGNSNNINKNSNNQCCGNNSSSSNINNNNKTSNISIVRTTPTSVTIQQTHNSISSSSNTIINTSSSISSSNNSSKNSCSGFLSSSSSPANSQKANGCSVLPTIEVPSVCGPIKRTPVIVQRTVGQSLLRTKNENNSAAGNNPSSNNNNNINVSNNKSNISNSVSLFASKSNNLSSNSNGNFSSHSNVISNIPTPPMTNSRPETPQSLPESEDDSCNFDILPEFLNFDNNKPMTGNLWDDFMAAVVQEDANGILPPLDSSNAFNDNNLKDHPAALDSDDLSPFNLQEELIAAASVCVKPTIFPEGKTSNHGSATPRSVQPASSSIIAAATTVVSDHSYDKSSWKLRLEDLYDTPSDSEEEIDVVSLLEGSRAASPTSSITSDTSDSGSSGLTTDPIPKDQEEIQVKTSKLLNAASKAVSRRLRSKITNKGKTFHPCNKRRLSDFDEYKTTATTKISKKPRIYYKSKSRFATDSESDSKEKRDMHNNMERMRRIDLRNSFEELKALVPSLVAKERAPKVQILQEAASYCTELNFESRKLTTQVAALRKEQERLRRTVSGLRRSLAAHR